MWFSNSYLRTTILSEIELFYYISKEGVEKEIIKREVLEELQAARAHKAS